MPGDDVDILVGADLSSLESALSNATSAAEASATAISSAFDIPVGDALTQHLQDTANAASTAGQQFELFGGNIGDASAQMTLFDTNSITAAESMQQIGDAASSAGPPIEEVGTAAHHAGEAATEAEGGLKGMAEQLVAIGEALIITEGLREFGQEALTAYGTVQSVTIGLTQLTGSVEQANEAVEKIKQLAATEPFAFPEIAPTIQKMVALGVSVEQLPAVMQAAADASAATGNAFSAVASSIDRLSLSGTAGARQLVALGLNTEQLGKAMGVTAGEVADAFKALDQSARIDVLTTALQKFAGAAEAQAQGISGQWQIFQNQFEEVMVGVGQALAPVIGDLLAFGKTVLSVLQGAAEAFNSLPTPVKEFAVVIGLGVAAIVPLTAALGAIGLGVAGLTAALPALEALLVSVGIAAGETAVAETEATAATIAFEAAAGGAGAAEGALATGAATAATGIGSMATAALGWAAAIAGPVLAAILVTKQQIKDLGEAYTDLNNTLHAKSIVDAINEGATVAALQNIGHSTKDLQDALTTMGQGGQTTFEKLAASVDPPITKFTEMGGTLNQLSTALKGIEKDGITAFDAIRHGATIPELQTVFGDLTKIIAAINGIKIASAEGGFAAMAEGLNITVAGLNLMTPAVTAAIGKTNELNNAVKNAKQVYDEAATAMRNHTAAANGEQVTQQTLTRLWGDYQKALVAANGAQKDAGNGLTILQQAMADVTVKARLQVDAFNNAVTIYRQLEGHAGDSAAAQQALSDQLKTVTSTAKALGIEVDTTGDKIKFGLEFPARDAATPLAALVDKTNGFGPAAAAVGVYINDKFVPALDAAVIAVDALTAAELANLGVEDQLGVSLPGVALGLGKIVNGVNVLVPAIKKLADGTVVLGANVDKFGNSAAGAAKSGSALGDGVMSASDAMKTFLPQGQAAYDTAQKVAASFASVTEAAYEMGLAVAKAGQQLTAGGSNTDFSLAGAKVSGSEFGSFFDSVMKNPALATDISNFISGQPGGNDTGYTAMQGNYRSPEVQAILDKWTSDFAAAQQQMVNLGMSLNDAGFYLSQQTSKTGKSLDQIVAAYAAAQKAAESATSATSAMGTAVGSTTLPLQVTGTNATNAAAALGDLGSAAAAVAGGFGDQSAAAIAAAKTLNDEFTLHAATAQDIADMIANEGNLPRGGVAGSSGGSTDQSTIQKAYDDYFAALTTAQAGLQIMGGDPAAEQKQLDGLRAAQQAAADALNKIVPQANAAAQSFEGVAGATRAVTLDASSVQKAYQQYFSAIQSAEAGLKDLTGDFAAQQKQLDGLYQAEKNAADALNAMVPGANAGPKSYAGQIGSTLNLAGDITAGGGYGKGTNYAALGAESLGRFTSLSINLNAGTVVGDNGMQKLAQMIQDKVIAQLKQAGLKL